MNNQITILYNLKIIKDARALITDPANWTQGEYAKDRQGDKCDPMSSKAICFCALGAIQKAGQLESDDNLPADWLEHSISKIKPQIISVNRFNDNHTHEEVLAVFDAAIAAAIAEVAQSPAAQRWPDWGSTPAIPSR